MEDSQVLFINPELTLRSTALRKKLMVDQLLKKLLETALPHSQEQASGPYLEPDAFQVKYG
jgi:hypothetical protein